MAKKEDRVSGTADGRKDRGLQRPRDNRTEESALRAISIAELRNVPISELQLRWQSRLPQFLSAISALRRDKYTVVQRAQMAAAEYVALLSIATQMLFTAEMTHATLTSFTVQELQRLIVRVDMESFRCQEEGLPFFSNYGDRDRQQTLMELEGHLRATLSLPSREQHRLRFTQEKIEDVEKLVGSYKQAVINYLSVVGDKTGPVPLSSVIELGAAIDSEVIRLVNSPHAATLKPQIQALQAKYQTYQALFSRDVAKIRRAPLGEQETKSLLLLALRTASRSLYDFLYANEFWSDWKPSDARLITLFRSTITIYTILQAFFQLNTQGDFEKKIRDAIKSVQEKLRNVPRGIEKKYENETQENFQEFFQALDYIQYGPYASKSKRD